VGTSRGYTYLNIWPRLDQLAPAVWLQPELVHKCARFEVEMDEPRVAALDLTGRLWSAAIADRTGRVNLFPPDGFDAAVDWLRGHSLPCCSRTPA